MPCNNSRKTDELNLKIERIRTLLEKKELNALLLQRVSSFAWATGGADSHINTASSDGESSLLITPQNKFIITTDVEVPRLETEEELLNQGWDFKVFPWYEKKDNLTEQLDEDTDDRPGRGVGLSENIRVVYGEEHNPNDG